MDHNIGAQITFCLLISLLFIFLFDLWRIPVFLHKQFKKSLKQHKMINTKILLKAMSFMFLPTLCILFIIFCWFFSWTDFSNFITSQSAGAAIMRIIMMVLEVILCAYMYQHYMDEYQKTQKKEKVNKFVLNPEVDSEGYKTKEYSTYVRDLFKNSNVSNRDCQYTVVYGPEDDLIFVKRTKIN